MRCPRCESDQLYKNGVRHLKDGTPVQYYQCRSCQKRFNERAGTPMSRLRSSVDEVSMALKMRSEGLGLRASGRVMGRSHGTIRQWEARFAEQSDAWSPPAPNHCDVTLEGDELYTKVGQNRPAHLSDG